MNKSILLDALGGLFNGVVHSRPNFNSRPITLSDLKSKFYNKILKNLKKYENNHYCKQNMKIIVENNLVNEKIIIDCCLNCHIGNIKLGLFYYGLNASESSFF